MILLDLQLPPVVLADVLDIELVMVSFPLMFLHKPHGRPRPRFGPVQAVVWPALRDFVDECTRCWRIFLFRRKAMTGGSGKVALKLG